MSSRLNDLLDTVSNLAASFQLQKFGKSSMPSDCKGTPDWAKQAMREKKHIWRCRIGRGSDWYYAVTAEDAVTEALRDAKKDILEGAVLTRHTSWDRLLVEDNDG